MLGTPAQVGEWDVPGKLLEANTQLCTTARRHLPRVLTREEDSMCEHVIKSKSFPLEVYFTVQTILVTTHGPSPAVLATGVLQRSHIPS